MSEIPHDNMRRTIARRLSEANQTIPQFYLTLDCEIDALLKLREDINTAAPKGKDGTPAFKVSVNDMVIKALALALVNVPGANVTFTESAMLHHHHADVAVAVAIPDGLITPIVRQADVLSLSAISNLMKDFAARAKERRLKPEEYQGGDQRHLQSRHVWDQGFLRRDQSAAILDSRDRHGRGAGDRPEGTDRHRHYHERDDHVRSSRHGWRQGRGADRRLQALHRKSCGDAGVSV